MSQWSVTTIAYQFVMEIKTEKLTQNKFEHLMSKSWEMLSDEDQEKIFEEMDRKAALRKKVRDSALRTKI